MTIAIAKLIVGIISVSIAIYNEWKMMKYRNDGYYNESTYRGQLAIIFFVIAYGLFGL